MATFTATDVTDGAGIVSAASTTTSRLARMFDPIHSVTGPDAEGAGHGPRAAVTRAGTAGPDMVATTYTEKSTRLGTGWGPTQLTAGFEESAGASGGAAPSARSAPSTRPGLGSAHGHSAPFTSDSRAGLNSSPTQSVTGMDPENGATASFLPAAYFRNLRGRVVNTDGEPISEATWIYSRSSLPTGAPVGDDGRFALYTLKQAYSDFMLIGRSGRRNLDYSWYQPVDTQVSATENDVTLVFETAELKGLYGGDGAVFGGQLG